MSRRSVTKADLDRAIECLQRLGVKVAEVDVTPGRVRLVTTHGRALNVPDDDAELDREIADLVSKHGHGQA